MLQIFVFPINPWCLFQNLALCRLRKDTATYDITLKDQSKLRSKFSWEICILKLCKKDIKFFFRNSFWTTHCDPIKTTSFPGKGKDCLLESLSTCWTVYCFDLRLIPVTTRYAEHTLFFSLELPVFYLKYCNPVS